MLFHVFPKTKMKSAIGTNLSQNRYSVIPLQTLTKLFLHFFHISICTRSILIAFLKEIESDKENFAISLRNTNFYSVQVVKITIIPSDN